MIPGITDRSTTLGPSSDSALGDLGEDTFLQLMVAQMQYQNPMEPSDPTQMLQQTGMMTQVEAMRDVLELQQQLIGFTEINLASGLVGKEVVAETAEGVVEGVVDAVRFTSGGPMLTVEGRELSLGDTRQVLGANGVAARPSGDTASGGTASGGTAAGGTASDGTASDGTASGGTAADPPATGDTPATSTDATTGGRTTGVAPVTDDVVVEQPPTPAAALAPTGDDEDGVLSGAGDDRPASAGAVAPATPTPAPGAPSDASSDALTWASVASATVGGRTNTSGGDAAADGGRATADRIRGGLRRTWL